MLVTPLVALSLLTIPAAIATASPAPPESAAHDMRGSSALVSAREAEPSGTVTVSTPTATVGEDIVISWTIHDPWETGYGVGWVSLVTMGPYEIYMEQYYNTSVTEPSGNMIVTAPYTGNKVRFVAYVFGETGGGNVTHVGLDEKTINVTGLTGQSISKFVDIHNTETDAWHQGYYSNGALKKGTFFVRDALRGDH